MNVVHCHTRDFTLAPLTPFAELAYALRPGATGKDLVELLDGRAERTLTLHWRAGRVHAPMWAIELLASQLERRHERERAIVNRARQKERPGLSAGALNLARWRANQNR
jgi:hypothetical protein